MGISNSEFNKMERLNIEFYYIKGEYLLIAQDLYKFIEVQPNQNLLLLSCKENISITTSVENISLINVNHPFYIQHKECFDIFYKVAPLLQKKCNSLKEKEIVAKELGVHRKSLERYIYKFRKNNEILEIHQSFKTKTNLVQNRVLEKPLLEIVYMVFKEVFQYNKDKHFPLDDAYKLIINSCKEKDIIPPSKATVFRLANKLNSYQRLINKIRTVNLNKNYKKLRKKSLINTKIKSFNGNYTRLNESHLEISTKYSVDLFNFAHSISKNTNSAMDALHEAILFEYDNPGCSFQDLKKVIRNYLVYSELKYVPLEEGLLEFIHYERNK